MPVQGCTLRDVALFPRGSVKNTLTMCHSPLRHGLRQDTHNTLGLGSWSKVSCLIQRQACHWGRSSAIRHPPTCPVATQAPGLHQLVTGLVKDGWKQRHFVVRGLNIPPLVMKYRSTLNAARQSDKVPPPRDTTWYTKSPLWRWWDIRKT
jgi:hypothetical protein